MNGAPQIRSLKNAPIAEAVIDFRTKLPSGFDVNLFKDLHKEYQAEFPGIKERRMVTHSFKLAPGLPVEGHGEDKGVIGYFFLSADEKKIAQFRKDGFSFNRLKPYSSWQQVFEEAWPLWKTYQRVAQPEVLVRIAVRFINRILLPLPIDRFEEYMTAAPVVPIGVPQIMSEFLTRVILHKPEKRIRAQVIQTIESPPVENSVTFILDIDAFREDSLEVTDLELIKMFNDLREYKNQIFFGSLTEKTISLFE